jgi:hypothetical protein
MGWWAEIILAVNSDGDEYYDMIFIFMSFVDVGFLGVEITKVSSGGEGFGADVAARLFPSGYLFCVGKSCGRIGASMDEFSGVGY